MLVPIGSHADVILSNGDDLDAVIRKKSIHIRVVTDSKDPVNVWVQHVQPLYLPEDSIRQVALPRCDHKTGPRKSIWLYYVPQERFITFAVDALTCPQCHGNGVVLMKIVLQVTRVFRHNDSYRRAAVFLYKTYGMKQELIQAC
ncbi:hypothetical protein MRX96_029598 [Rhipicephalus microplus]